MNRLPNAAVHLSATALVVAGAVLLAAATIHRSPSNHLPARAPTRGPDKAAIVHLHRSQTSLAAYPIREAIADSLTFRREWRNLVGTNPSPPTVDFARYTVLVVAMGSVGSTGHLIGVYSLDSTSSSGLRVQTRLVAPGRGCPAGGAFTSPIDVVRIPSASPIVFFDDTLIENPC